MYSNISHLISQCFFHIRELDWPLVCLESNKCESLKSCLQPVEAAAVITLHNMKPFQFLEHTTPSINEMSDPHEYLFFFFFCSLLYHMLKHFDPIVMSRVMTRNVTDHCNQKGSSSIIWIWKLYVNQPCEIWYIVLKFTLCPNGALEERPCHENLRQHLYPQNGSWKSQASISQVWPELHATQRILAIQINFSWLVEHEDC